MVETALSFSTLPDACNDRVISKEDCPMLANKPLEDKKLFSGLNNNPDWKLLREFLLREGHVTKSQCTKIIKETLACLKT